MKKGLILSALLALSLGACGNTNSSKDSLNGNSTIMSYYDFDYYIDNARYELEMMCMYPIESIDDEEITECIYTFYGQENEYIDSIEDLYEASELLTTINIHLADFMRTTFSVIINSRIDEYANPIIATVNIPAAKNAVIEYVNGIKNRIAYGGLDFVEAYNECNMFFWGFEEQVVRIVWEHGGSWQPGEEKTKWQDEINDLWEFLDSLAFEVHEYMDLELDEFVNENLIPQFDDCETGFDARNLLEELKCQLFDKVFELFTRTLCDLYAEFVQYVVDSISDNECKEDIVNSADAIYGEIVLSESIESAIISYENAVYDSKDIVWAKYQTIAQNLLDDILRNCYKYIGDNDDKKLELTIIYAKYVQSINVNMRCELEYLEETMTKILDEFADYCEELIRA